MSIEDQIRAMVQAEVRAELARAFSGGVTDRRETPRPKNGKAKHPATCVFQGCRNPWGGPRFYGFCPEHRKTRAFRYRKEKTAAAKKK